MTLQMITTMGMAATTTISMGVATMVTTRATSTTAAPLQQLLPHLQVVVLQLLPQLLLARGIFLAMATLTTATTTTMSPAQHQLQLLLAVVMLLLPPQLHPQVTLSSLSLCYAGYHSIITLMLWWASCLRMLSAWSSGPLSANCSKE